MSTIHACDENLSPTNNPLVNHNTYGYCTIILVLKRACEFEPHCTAVTYNFENIIAKI